MAPIAIAFGILLMLLGGGRYAYTEMASITALIPAFFGLPLIILGMMACNEKLRMHAMHGAALLGLVGFALPAYLVTTRLIRRNEFTMGALEQTDMAALCAVFLALCVKSFIDARTARKQRRMPDEDEDVADGRARAQAPEADVTGIQEHKP